MNVIVREIKSGFRKNDELHKHCLYFPDNDGRYMCLYTCMCCSDVFVRLQDRIDEPDNGTTLTDVHTDLLKHFLKCLKKSKNIRTSNLDNITLFLEKEIKERKKNKK